ncbi:MAG: LytTR family DNA-binding domain-containing protein, partial [Bacteroidota bacterium]
LIQPVCPIIFCTAYDQFYQEAFQTNGIAYLLKPYDEDAFQTAWQKYERLFAQEQKQSLPPDWLETIRQLAKQGGKRFKSSFTVRKRDGIFILKSKEVAYFQAQKDFVMAFDFSGKKHLLSERISGLETSLDPHQFFRINRSEMIQFDAIIKFDPFSKSKLGITIRPQEEILYTAASRTPDFREWINQR